MYYSSGNYEAFATPKKPEGIENKSAYVVGTGLAGLAAACFSARARSVVNMRTTAWPRPYWPSWKKFYKKKFL